MKIPDFNNISLEDIGGIIEELFGASESDLMYDYFVYSKTDEYRKKCEPYEKMKVCYENLFNTYNEMFPIWKKTTEADTFREEFSSGGEMIHRGFYSPSALDMVVSGCSRGKLLKRMPPKTFTYRFLFDKSDRLICAECYARDLDLSYPYYTEFLRYDGDTVFGFQFETACRRNTITRISKCVYNEKDLIRYETADVYKGRKSVCCTDISIETPLYKNGKMDELIHCSYSPATHMISKDRYAFTRDSEGFFDTFTIEHTSYDGRITTDPNHYKVLHGKRK